MPGFGMRHRDGRLKLPGSSSLFLSSHLRDYRPSRQEQEQAAEKAEQIKACETLVARFGSQHVIGRNALAKLMRLTDSEEQSPEASGGARGLGAPGHYPRGANGGRLPVHFGDRFGSQAF
jgi:hypothetical protein